MAQQTTIRGAVGPIPARSSSARTAARIPPIAELKLGWQERGLCQSGDATVFFAPDSERIREREKREAAAKRVCEECPVRQQCLEHALALPEQFGIWGGLTELERAEEGRRRRGATSGRAPVVVPIRIGTQRDRGFAEAQAQASREGTEVAA
ncbi:WhiB family transcriptional regulator [Catenulispora subtropica]|uniref:Transcriptional regulator WhiB n=1 Tax=Catenulispora subtropica TaxID=450798 RepID=A0ABN2QNW8_9ACTN